MFAILTILLSRI